MSRSFALTRIRALAFAAVAVVLTVHSARGQGVTKGRDPLAGLDAYVGSLMKEWQVPGMSIAVVRGDSAILTKGYGVREVGGDVPVDAHTIFAIGSASKAFTGAALSLLADDGKVDFDRRVTEYLPGFEMYDPWVTREIRVRDLLLHRSGMSRGDNLWYGTTRSRMEIVQAIRHLEPSTSFRTHFQYQNLMYITAGEVVRSASGMSWDDFVKSRIFAPLGMNESNTSVRDLTSGQNVAAPHALLNGAVRAIPWRNIDNAAAAGSINSNAADMSQWLRFWINGGMVNGKPVLSTARVTESITPQFIVDEPGLIARLMSPPTLGYGFGWFVQTLRGRTVVSHGGNIDGMAAMVAFLPDEKVGIVVLTNMNQSDITIPLHANIVDRLLGISPPHDYNAEYRVALKKFDDEARAGDAARPSGRYEAIAAAGVVRGHLPERPSRRSDRSARGQRRVVDRVRVEPGRDG
ncbi:MAG: serine hydrolase domain-containing protein [Gemmatimonadaceae bacterium]